MVCEVRIMSCGLGLSFYVSDRKHFIEELVSYVREHLATDGNIAIEQCSDELTIGYETMWISIYLSDYENFCRTVEDAENVRVNFHMTVWLYRRKYRQGVIDSAKIVKWYLSNYKGDCVWDEEGATVLVRRDGEVFFESGTNFPVRYSQTEEFYSIDYKIVYRGVEFEPRKMEKRHLEEMAIEIFTYDINAAEQYHFSPQFVTYVKKIHISEADKRIVNQVWTTDENKDEIYTNNIDIAKKYGFSPKCGIYEKRIPFSEVEKLIVTKVWITGKNKGEVIVQEKDIASFIENYPFPAWQ